MSSSFPNGSLAQRLARDIFDRLPREEQIEHLKGILDHAVQFNEYDEQVAALLPLLKDAFGIRNIPPDASYVAYWRYLMELYEKIPQEDRYGYNGFRSIPLVLLGEILNGWRWSLQQQGHPQPHGLPASECFRFVCGRIERDREYDSKLGGKIVDLFTVDTYVTPHALIPWIVEPATPVLVQQKLLHGLLNLRSGWQGDPLVGVPLVVDFLKGSGPESGMP